MDRQPAKSTPLDVFIYLFATGTLYFSAFSVILLLVSYVDILLPDPLKEHYDGPASAIRWFLAMLIVIFPAYLWAMRFIRRAIARESAKADIKIRKWLIYLTLFLAAILIIGDLVGLIFNFLEGDLSSQFVLKVLSVGAVAAAIFWYYHMDLRTRGTAYEPRAKRAVYVLVALVSAVAVTGFVLAGSPFRQRMVRFDEQKTGHLQNIQWQVVEYWRNKDTLPESVDLLRDTISGYVPPKDPQSGEPYDYRVTGELSFELCAEYNLPSEKTPFAARYPERSAMFDNWDHGPGRVCFERTIDRDVYGRRDGEPLGKPLPVAP